MAGGAAVRDRKKEATWRRHVRGQAASGLSVVGYCRRHGLRVHGYYWWRRELARRDRAKPPAFVPVTVAAEMSTLPRVGRVEIILPGNRRVRVTGVVDRQMLADVLLALQASEDRRGQGEERRC
jgi:transposase-like protein